MFRRSEYFWLRFGDQFVFQNPRKVWASHSPEWILGCALVHMVLLFLNSRKNNLLSNLNMLARKYLEIYSSRFGFVKLLALSGSHCTKWADEQHRPAGFESRLVPDLSLPFIPTLIGLRAFGLVSSPVWWEAAINSPRGLSRNLCMALNLAV